MVEFVINGKDYSDEDINLLICRDSITDFTEVKMYCDHEEIQLNSDTSEIDVTVNIRSSGLMKRFDNQRDLSVSLNYLERIALALKKEIAVIRENAR